ncbi:hypothetical protein [Enterovibrio norvegicus]|uniref:hypothetical protein n=1 Tax=Enterovibrio norvegicus TaxID=188144 RepID=UPI0010BEE822|nr:hypothetical protein [Enterovibrio norvegicus]TKF30055.1 hypothetical protein FCV83_19860 [Enterovibrio norvegicus]
MDKMNNHHRALTILLGSVLTLAGCAQTPPDVQASLPLMGGVSAPDYAMLPQNMSNALMNNQTVVATPSGQAFNVSESYFSALGIECRQLTGIKIKPVITSSVCLIDNTWVNIGGTENGEAMHLSQMHAEGEAQ